MKAWGGVTLAASVRSLRGTTMQLTWTITLQRTGGGLPAETRTVARYQRSVGPPRPADVGLCRSEGQELVAALQSAVVQDQITAHDHRGRSCHYCGRYRRIKDWRGRQIDTALGRVRVRIPRVVTCQCLPEPLGEEGEITALRDSESTVERLLPKRRTPEVSYLCAKHGASSPYRTAARAVCEVTGLPRLSHATVRSETTSCGEHIEDEQFEIGWFALDRAGGQPDPAQHLRVSIDGTVITSANKVEFSKFEVIAGRVERDGHPGRRFACAMQRRSLTRVLIAAALAQSGMTRRTEVDVVNDGARGMRSIVAEVAPRMAPRIIDWFHIAMKLQAVRTPIAARKGIWTPIPSSIVRAERLATKVRDALWRGKGEVAIAMLDTVQATLAEAASDHNIHEFFRGCSRTAERAAMKLLEFLRNNRDDLVDYQRARMAGRRISTASAESVMNHLINRRMSKLQQMRWNYASAHRMLMVRVELLDGRLENCFRRRFPGFRSPDAAPGPKGSP